MFELLGSGQSCQRATIKWQQDLRMLRKHIIASRQHCPRLKHINLLCVCYGLLRRHNKAVWHTHRRSPPFRRSVAPVALSRSPMDVVLGDVGDVRNGRVSERVTTSRWSGEGASDSVEAHRRLSRRSPRQLGGCGLWLQPQPSAPPA